VDVSYIISEILDVRGWNDLEIFFKVVTSGTNQMIRMSMTLAIFQGHQTVSHQISRKRCVIRQKLLQSTNRKSYTSFRLVPLWWPWSTFEGHFSLRCPFHVHYSNLWPAFASRGLPAIAKLQLFSVWFHEAQTKLATRQFLNSDHIASYLCGYSTDNGGHGGAGAGHRRSFHGAVFIWDASQWHADHRGSACSLQRVSVQRRWRSFFTRRVTVLGRPTSTVTVDIVTSLSRTAGMHWPRHLQKLHLYMQRR